MLVQNQAAQGGEGLATRVSDGFAQRRELDSGQHPLRDGFEIVCSGVVWPRTGLKGPHRDQAALLQTISNSAISLFLIVSGIEAAKTGFQPSDTLLL